MKKNDNDCVIEERLAGKTQFVGKTFWTLEEFINTIDENITRSTSKVYVKYARQVGFTKKGKIKQKGFLWFKFGKNVINIWLTDGEYKDDYHKLKNDSDAFRYQCATFRENEINIGYLKNIIEQSYRKE
jgi:hypothetical protein